MSQGIDVGDAVLHFLGDTTQLDAAFNKVADEAGAKLGPVNDGLQEVAGNWQFAGQTATLAGEATVEATAEASGGVKMLRQDLYEARGEAALLGEMTGVRLPRHVRNFVATLPGVGEALKAAFTATAVLFLLQAVKDLTEKVTEFVGEHFIFTEELKQGYAQLVANNKVLLAYSDAFNKAKETIDTFGKTSSQLLGEKLQDINTQLGVQKEAWYQAHTAMWFYKQGIDQLTVEQYAKLHDQFDQSHAAIVSLEEQKAALQLMYDKAAADEQRKAIDTEIANDKSAGESKLALRRAQAALAQAMTKDDYVEQGRIRAQFDEQEYQIQVTAIRRQLALLTEENLETYSKRAQFNTQLLNLQRQHDAKLIDAQAQLFDMLKANQHKGIPLVDVPLTNPDFVVGAIKDFRDVRDAAAALGVQLSFNLMDDLAKTEAQFKKLMDSGVLLATDKILLQIEVLNKRIAVGKAFQQDMSAEQKQVEALQKAYNKMTGVVSDSLDKLDAKFAKAKTPMIALFQAIINGTTTVEHAMTLFGTVMAEGIGQSVTAALEGSQSFGQAMEQFLKSTLSSLAGQAVVQAIVETAKGFAALSPTNPDFGHAPDHFTSAAIWATVAGASAAAASFIPSGGSSGSSVTAASTSASTSSAVGTGTTSQSPIAAVNVQKFAGGGLVMGPTLAMIGDSRSGTGQREAAIPLDDPRAIAPIVKALTGGSGVAGGPTIHVNVQGLISPDNLTKVIGQISRKVRANQATLVSTNSFRLTKRSV